MVLLPCRCRNSAEIAVSTNGPGPQWPPKSEQAILGQLFVSRAVRYIRSQLQQLVANRVGAVVSGDDCVNWAGRLSGGLHRYSWQLLPEFIVVIGPYSSTFPILIYKVVTVPWPCRPVLWQWIQQMAHPQSSTCSRSTCQTLPSTFFLPQQTWVRSPASTSGSVRTATGRVL